MVVHITGPEEQVPKAPSVAPGSQGLLGGSFVGCGARVAGTVCSVHRSGQDTRVPLKSLIGLVGIR